MLDLDDTLIHSDWTRGRGWKTFKRPGAEDFIRTMAQYYELVSPMRPAVCITWPKQRN